MIIENLYQKQVICILWLFGMLFAIQISQYLEVRSRLSQFVILSSKFTTSNGQDACVKIKELEQIKGITLYSHELPDIQFKLKKTEAISKNFNF